MRTILFAAAMAPLLLLGMDAASAHSGGLDANGCHYEDGKRNYHCHQEVQPNPDVNAPVKKSRENICHDKTSPNYKTLKYFIGYPTMKACVKSGGVKFNSGGAQ